MIISYTYNKWRLVLLYVIIMNERSRNNVKNKKDLNSERKKKEIKTYTVLGRYEKFSWQFGKSHHIKNTSRTTMRDLTNKKWTTRDSKTL